MRYFRDMQHDGERETIDETISSGNARIEASRRMIDDLDRRLSRSAELLSDADGSDSDLPG